MKLSDQMPAQMDSTLPAKMPDSMPSQAKPTAGGGSDDAPVVPIATTIPTQSQQVDNLNLVGEKWQTTDKKTGSSWEVTDRVESNKGGLPQRDPDNDGDLN